MKKFKLIILIPVFFILGCYGDYIRNRQINNITNISKEYCHERGFKKCEQYHLCMVDNYDKVKKNKSGDVSIAISYITLYSPVRYDRGNYSYLMDNTYNLLNADSHFSNNLNLVISISYFIYAHNSCASITGDKTYNIDSYMPLLREKLGIK